MGLVIFYTFAAAFMSLKVAHEVTGAIPRYRHHPLSERRADERPQSRGGLAFLAFLHLVCRSPTGTGGPAL